MTNDTTTRSTTVTILAGLHDRHGAPISSRSLTNDPTESPDLRGLLRRIGAIAGGFTMTETVGGWTDEDGELHTEKGAQIVVSLTETPEQRDSGHGLWNRAFRIAVTVRGFLFATDQESALVHTPEGGWTTLPASDEGDDSTYAHLATAMIPTP